MFVLYSTMLTFVYSLQLQLQHTQNLKQNNRNKEGIVHALTMCIPSPTATREAVGTNRGGENAGGTDATARQE
jgi:hypothetical protein